MGKLIAIDLDGTLLNSFGEISIKNKEKLIEAHGKGAEIVLASGRTTESILNFATELGICNYLISGNGAIVYDIKNQKILSNKFMKKSRLLEVIKTCEESGIYYNIYTEEAVITKSLKYNTLFYSKENEKKSDDKKTKIEIIENIYKYVEEREKCDYTKVTICAESFEMFSNVIEKLKQIKNVEVLDVSRMTKKIIKCGDDEIKLEYFYTEISNENVNKWTAIEYLIKKLNIDKKDVIAIGDNINDKEMLVHAEIGIATGNSNPEIKKIAKLVVADNNSDGVSEAVEKILV